MYLPFSEVSISLQKWNDHKSNAQPLEKEDYVENFLSLKPYMKEQPSVKQFEVDRNAKSKRVNSRTAIDQEKEQAENPKKD